jgi:ParB-like chromosome segregation protein Spo0J
MARGGARPGAGRPAGKSPNTSPPSRGRAHAREAAGNQRPWPADKVERWAIDRLIPYAKNARTHSDAQIAAIAASIKEWGWTTPALVGEDGGLIAGHARILAARQLGIAEIPVMVAAGWSEAQKRAYVLADNQLAITGSGWDPELLRLELGELNLAGFDLSLTGFGDLELGSLLADKTEGGGAWDSQQRVGRGGRRPGRWGYVDGCG